jgi:hypothetical protein
LARQLEEIALLEHPEHVFRDICHDRLIHQPTASMARCMAPPRPQAGSGMRPLDMGCCQSWPEQIQGVRLRELEPLRDFQPEGTCPEAPEPSRGCWRRRGGECDTAGFFLTASPTNPLTAKKSPMPTAPPLDQSSNLRTRIFPPLPSAEPAGVGIRRQRMLPSPPRLGWADLARTRLIAWGQRHRRSPPVAGQDGVAAWRDGGRRGLRGLARGVWRRVLCLPADGEEPRVI